jgi:hypothetical protein
MARPPSLVEYTPPHDHGLAAGQAHGALVGVLEGAPDLGHAVDPGLELGRDGEVVERRTDHDHVGLKELAHQLFGQRILAALRIRGGFLTGAKAQGVGAQVGHHIGGQVQVLDLRARMGRHPGGHGAGGQIAGNRLVAGDGGIDVQQFHGGLLKLKATSVAMDRLSFQIDCVIRRQNCATSFHWQDNQEAPCRI